MGRRLDRSSLPGRRTWLHWLGPLAGAALGARAYRAAARPRAVALPPAESVRAYAQP